MKNQELRIKNLGSKIIFNFQFQNFQTIFNFRILKFLSINDARHPKDVRRQNIENSKIENSLKKSKIQSSNVKSNPKLKVQIKESRIKNQESRII